MDWRGVRLLFLAACWMWAGGTRAQTPLPALADDTFVSRQRQFELPLRVDPLDRPRVLEAQLHVSSDRGRTWKHYLSARPQDPAFLFQAPADGEYWFAVRVAFRDGKMEPVSMVGVTPGKKVVVDTKPPEIFLRPAQSLDGQIGVEWDIRGNDADLNSLRLEYRPPGTSSWQPLGVSPTAQGKKMWSPVDRKPIEARLHCSDRAGNFAQQVVSLNPTGSGGRADPAPGFLSSNNEDGFPTSEFPMPGRPKQIANGDNPVPSGRLASPDSIGRGTTSPERSAPRDGADIPRKYVNTKQFSINFTLQDVGKSGVKIIELYWLTPARRWLHDPGADSPKSPCRVTAESEGVYGIRLRAISGVDLADEPPTTVAPPQIWVIVDLTPPEINLYPPQIGRGSRAGIVSFKWSVRDENPAPRKVRLSYSSTDGPDAGQWRVLAKGLDTSGTHEWKMPSDAPYRFYVRIEAEDLAGNVSRQDTQDPVVVDYSKPRPVILGVEPYRDAEVAEPKPPVTRPPSATPTMDDQDEPPAKRAPTRSIKSTPAASTRQEKLPSKKSDADEN